MERPAQQTRLTLGRVCISIVILLVPAAIVGCGRTDGDPTTVDAAAPPDPARTDTTPVVAVTNPSPPTPRLEAPGIERVVLAAPLGAEARNTLGSPSDAFEGGYGSWLAWDLPDGGRIEIEFAGDPSDTDGLVSGINATVEFDSSDRIDLFNGLVLGESTAADLVASGDFRTCTSVQKDDCDYLQHLCVNGIPQMVLADVGEPYINDLESVGNQGEAALLTRVSVFTDDSVDAPSVCASPVTSLLDVAPQGPPGSSSGESD